MIVTIFKNILETKTPFHVQIDKIIDRVALGQSKELVQKIRNCTDKSQRTELKKQLPSICFSGKFSARANNSIIEHSGLVCLDFDHLENPEQFKKELKNDKYVMLAFISPSGDGLKVVIQIPKSIEDHAFYCRGLKNYFSKVYLTDKLDNFEDVARVCFESYDPDIFINLQSEIFKEKINISTPQIRHENNSNDIFAKLVVWIEKFDTYMTGNKHKFLVKLAGACNRFGIPENETINLLLSNYQNKADFVQTKDIEKIVIKIYSNYRNQFNISHFEETGHAYDRNNNQLITNDFFNDYKTDENEDLKTLLFTKYKLDWSKEYKQPEFIMFICEGKKWFKIGSLGNFTCISGKSKSRKSYAKHFFEASSLKNGRLNEKFIVKLPENKTNIIEFDTEQGVTNVFNAAFRMVKMAEIKSVDHYQVFATREMNHLERCAALEIAIKYTPNLGLLFLDGAADLAFGNNDEKEANRVVQFLMYLTAHYNIHISTIMHQPKGQDWLSGHLGSAIEKKAESVINIKKDGNYSIFEAKQLRNCADFAPFPFLINSDGIPELITDETVINEIFDNEI